MEHGSFTNDSHASFTLAEEDHTLANSLRFMLNQDPRVTLAGYSIPHPSLECVNVRVQTTVTPFHYCDPAREVLKDACQELMLMNRHVRSVFDTAVTEFKEEQARFKAEEERKKAAEEELKKQRNLLESMDIKSN